MVVVLLAAGLILIGVSSTPALDIAGIVLAGTAMVFGVAAIFYEVGASEDRERAETEKRRRRTTGGDADRGGGR